MSPSFTSAKQLFPGRVSAGAAGTFLAEEEKQLRVSKDSQVLSHIQSTLISIALV